MAMEETSNNSSLTVNIISRLLIMMLMMMTMIMLAIQASLKSNSMHTVVDCTRHSPFKAPSLFIACFESLILSGAALYIPRVSIAFCGHKETCVACEHLRLQRVVQSLPNFLSGSRKPITLKTNAIIIIVIIIAVTDSQQRQQQQQTTTTARTTATRMTTTTTTKQQP